MKTEKTGSQSVKRKSSRPEVTITIADKVYVPLNAYKALRGTIRTSLKRNLSKDVFDANNCELYTRNLFCPIAAGVPSYKKCMHCEQAKRVISCYRITSKYFSFDRGNLNLMATCIAVIQHELESMGYTVHLEDKRVYFKLPVGMQISSNWSAFDDPSRLKEQRRVAKAWIKAKGGQVKAPARFGKTGLASIIAAKSKTRVAVFAHQKELIDQFSLDFYKFTDLTEKEKLLGRPLLAINPRPEDVEKYSVCLYTYQQFVSKYGKSRLRAVRKLFGLTIVDEAHRSSADTYSSVLSRFYAKYRLGLTATPKRRDGLDFRQSCILGPVQVEGGSEQLSCDFSIEDTSWVMPSYSMMRNREWNLLWSAMVKASARNDFIASLVAYDLAQGHKIVIPVRRLAHLEEIIHSLLRNNVCRMEQIANLNGSLDKSYRAEIVDDIRAGKYKVVVAIDKLVSLGFNAKPLSCIYLNAGGYHFTMDNAYQEYSRIRTAMPGKNKPVIRILNDTGDVSARSTKKLVQELESKGFKEIEPVSGKVKSMVSTMSIRRSKRN